jgi:hypothetical protein
MAGWTGANALLLSAIKAATSKDKIKDNLAMVLENVFLFAEIALKKHQRSMMMMMMGLLLLFAYWQG